MLLLATGAWAVSFSLGKDAGARVNALAGLGHGAMLGPLVVQGVRFAAATGLWFLLPAARRGWTGVGVWRGAYTGALLGAGVILQHLALEYTSPAATAFLTALTVIWVPLLLCVVKRRLPAGPLVVGVVLAVVGLYLMLGEGLTEMRPGEMLGLGCSLAFTFHLLAVTHVVKREGPWRMCGAQFAVCGVMCLAMAWGVQGERGGVWGAALGDAAVMWRVGAIVSFPTLVAFGLMTVYQPRLDSTRATLIYQAEPVLAAGFDYLLAGRGLTPMGLVGAVLIVGANLIAELLPARSGEAEAKGEMASADGGERA